jgi:TPR repeat protein
VTLNDEQTRSAAATSALTNLASGVARDGFDAGSKWLATANLSQKEMKAFTGGLNNQVKAGEAGRWVEWIGETIPHGETNGDIRNIVRNWTENDYQAAGKWLATTADGPAKNTSIRTYAETASKYEPETAAQWAMTLPPGKDREATLKNIHKNWPKDDTAAKDAFAKEHGIK